MARRSIGILAPLLLMSVGDICLAQSDTQQLSLPEIGTTVSPRADLKALERPPSVLFLATGEETSISRTVHYEVVEIEEVRSLLAGVRYYVRIRELNDGPCREKNCWVYLGPKAARVTPNLVTIQKPEEP